MFELLCILGLTITDYSTVTNLLGLGPSLYLHTHFPAFFSNASYMLVKLKYHLFLQLII